MNDDKTNDRLSLLKCAVKLPPLGVRRVTVNMPVAKTLLVGANAITMMDILAMM